MHAPCGSKFVDLVACCHSSGMQSAGRESTDAKLSAWHQVVGIIITSDRPFKRPPLYAAGGCQGEAITPVDHYHCEQVANGAYQLVLLIAMHIIQSQLQRHRPDPSISHHFLLNPSEPRIQSANSFRFAWKQVSCNNRSQRYSLDL